jgi:hypothetical protein
MVNRRTRFFYLLFTIYYLLFHACIASQDFWKCFTRYVRRCRVKLTTTLISSWRWFAWASDRVTGLSVTSEAFAVAPLAQEMMPKLRVLIDESGALRDNERAALLSRRVK